MESLESESHFQDATGSISSLSNRIGSHITSALDVVGGISSPMQGISSFPTNSPILDSSIHSNTPPHRFSISHENPSAPEIIDLELGALELEDNFYISDWDGEVEEFLFYSNVPSRVNSSENLFLLGEEEEEEEEESDSNQIKEKGPPAYTAEDRIRKQSHINSEIMEKVRLGDENFRKTQYSEDEAFAMKLQEEEKIALEMERDARRKARSARKAEELAIRESGHRSKDNLSHPTSSSNPKKSRKVDSHGKDSDQPFQIYTESEPGFKRQNQASSSPLDKYGKPVSPNKNSPSIPKALYNPKVRKQLAKMHIYRPYFIITVTTIQFIMLLLIFIFYYVETGSIIQTTPFNLMVGPNINILIGFGARYVPCMRPQIVLNRTGLQCPEGVQGSLPGSQCTTSDLEHWCGLARFSGDQPDQWYRFILAIFLHSGLVHWAFVTMFQLRTALQMEKDFGWWRIGIIYLSSGVGGFLFGANFNVDGPACGASGALFGLIACLLLDLIQNWPLLVRPFQELIKMIIVIIFAFAVGLLPYVDNFSHFGGFCTGIFMGLIFMPSIHFGKWDTRRKRALMILALPCLTVLFTIGLKAFYSGSTGCTWCEYLECLPFLPGLCNSSVFGNGKSTGSI